MQGATRKEQGAKSKAQFFLRFRRIRIHRTSRHFNIRDSLRLRSGQALLDIRYSFFFFISFSENSDSSNIDPLQHSKFCIGYSIFLFLLHLVFGEFRFFEHRATSTFKIQYWIFDIPFSSSSRFQRIRILRTSRHFNIQNSRFGIGYSIFLFS